MFKKKLAAWERFFVSAVEASSWMRSLETSGVCPRIVCICSSPIPCHRRDYLISGGRILRVNHTSLSTPPPKKPVSKVSAMGFIHYHGHRALLILNVWALLKNKASQSMAEQKASQLTGVGYFDPDRKSVV